MKACVLAAIALAARSILAGEDDPEARISIPDLLDPAKRVAALQAFVIRSDPSSAKQDEWDDPAKFAAAHAGLQVREIAATAPGKARVLVTYDGGSFTRNSDAWPADSQARAFTPKRNEPLMPFYETQYSRFDAEGRALGGPRPEWSYHSNVGDFNNDGSIEVAEYTGVNGFPGSAHESCAGWEYSYAVIRPAGQETKPVFAVLYAMHPENRVEVSPWGGQLLDEDGDGVFEFQIGPRVDGLIKPEVTFRWNAALGTWAAPDGKHRIHYRLLKLVNVGADIRHIAEAGGLQYKMELRPKDAEETERLNSPFSLVETLTADEVSKPYRYASLATLTDEQILDWMIRRRSVWDVVREQVDAAANVPGLWELDPKAAALAYFSAHRPPSTRANFRYALDDSDGQAAPDTGTVTVADGPSGCGAPSGAFVHFLHCAPGDSYLAFAGSLGSQNLSPIEGRSTFDFRKISLSDAEARHTLQMIWWLGRIRAQRLGGEDSGGGGAGSTSDGIATVLMEAGNERMRIEGIRFAGHMGASVAVGYGSYDYDQIGFLNLVVYFFNQDLVAHLGERWPKFDLGNRNDAQPGRDPYRPGEREHVAELSAEWVRMFLQGSIPPAVTGVAIEAVGELGLKNLRSEVARMVDTLPPPSVSERRLKELDAALATWKKAHGPQGTDMSEVGQRKYSQGPTQGTVPGLEPLPGANEAPVSVPTATPAPKKAPGSTRFAKFDALFEEREAVSQDQPSVDREIATLRNDIALTLRKLDAWDDARALERWALEDEMGLYRAGTRLAQVDRKRAFGVLRHYVATSSSEVVRDGFKILLADETGASPDIPRLRLSRKDKLSHSDLAALLKVLRDAKSSIEDRQNALQALVPRSAPGRYPSPEIDQTLLGSEVIKGYGFNLIDDLSTALALRLGAKSWNRLIELSALSDEYDMPKFRDVLPALSTLAQREPALFREPLAKLLEPQFVETNGDLERVFWCAWWAELRMLKPALERVATSSPEDAEGQWATTYGNHKSAVSDRYHLARQIVSIWNEEDALVRAKLLVAFGIANSAGVMDHGAEPMRAHLQTVASILDAGQRTAVLAFVAECAAEPPEKWPPLTYLFSMDQSDPRPAFFNLVHAASDQH